MFSNFFSKTVRSPQEIEKDVIDYLQKEMVNTKNENCYTYKKNENTFFNRPSNDNKYIPKDDFKDLNAEIQSHISDIAERNNLFKKAEITHVIKSQTEPKPEPIGPDYYAYDNIYNGFYKIGKYYYSKQNQGAGENIRNPEPQLIFINTETNDETTPKNNVYEYTPIEVEAEAKLVGGKPKKTRRRKNKKRRSSRRKN